MTHLDLFSGIGGFTLAAKWAGIETVLFCEKDAYAVKVLKKNFPLIPIVRDIRELNDEKFYEVTGRTTVDIISGGFPCQPYSIAGKRLGSKDDRELWPEMFRVIKEIRPAWVIGENVAHFINMGFDKAVSDLESEGYEVQAYIIPACAVEAVHRRDRVWIIANAKGKYGDALKVQEREPQKDVRKAVKESGDIFYEHNGANHYVFRKKDQTRICREHDGVPEDVDRLRCLGNAIVPQVAYEIFKAIRAV
jgi:DNA (cytosine-5)-methyltransferase 1